MIHTFDLVHQTLPRIGMSNTIYGCERRPPLWKRDYAGFGEVGKRVPLDDLGKWMMFNFAVKSYMCLTESGYAIG